MADRLLPYRQIARSLVCTLAVISASGCTHDEGVSLEQLRNMTYSSSLGQSGRVKLVNGEYRARAVPNSSVDLSLKLTPQVAFGDLDGDGHSDAAVVLESDSGGSGSFYSLAVVVDARGKPRHVASMDLGDRTDVTAIAIVNRTIELKLLQHAPADPLCCPSLRVAQAYVLRGSRVVPANRVAATNPQ